MSSLDEYADSSVGVSERSGASPDLKRTKRRKQSQDDSQRTDKLPPHAPEAEQGILGCVLLSPNECLSECIVKLRDESEFFDLRHQTIYGQMVQMYDERVQIDLITVQQRLKDWGMLDEIGGIPYLNALQDSVPSAANLSYYIDIVTEKAKLRRMINFCSEFVGRAYNYTGEIDGLADEFERDTQRLSERRSDSDATPIADSVQSALDTIESLVNNRGQGIGIATGFPDLDRMTLGGLKLGEVFIIAARPSMGKTSLGMNIAENISLGAQIPVGVLSLEMTKEALTLRQVCSTARVSLQNINQGYFTDEQYPVVTAAAARVRSARMYIDDTPGISIMQARAKARRMVQRFGIRVIVIDYLQLMHSTSKKAQTNRQVEVAEISAGVKSMAKELNIAVVILAQLNRDIEQTAGKKTGPRKPRLSDLRESGAIEQDADVVGMLYKPEPNDENPENETSVLVNLSIAKQRNGPTGDVNLVFLKPYTRFESAARVGPEDVPQQPTEQQGDLPV